VRFSPYAHVDLEGDLHFHGHELERLFSDPKPRQLSQEDLARALDAPVAVIAACES